MIRRSLLYDLTPEDRRTRAKWARGVAIVYGSVLVLLLAFIITKRVIVEPSEAPNLAAIGANAASHVARGRPLLSP
jgi:hypothetical protein